METFQGKSCMLCYFIFTASSTDWYMFHELVHGLCTAGTKGVTFAERKVLSYYHPIVLLAR